MTAPLVHPVTGAPLKLGRTRPLPVERRKFHLPLRQFISKPLPPPPDQTNFAAKAMGCLHQMMNNDKLSCCTSAMAFHILGSWFGNAGHPVLFSNAQVVDFYGRSTGYVAGKPETDQGGDEIAVLDCWRTQGLIKGRREIIGHLAINADDIAEVKNGLWLGGGLCAGAEMPADWVGKNMPAKDGDVWPLAGDPDMDDGHAFAGIDFNADGLIVCTWGMLVLIPWPAVRKYLVRENYGELHVAFSEDSLDLASKRAPNGLDIAGIRDAFQQLGAAA